MKNQKQVWKIVVSNLYNNPEDGFRTGWIEYWYLNHFKMDTSTLREKGGAFERNSSAQPMWLKQVIDWCGHKEHNLLDLVVLRDAGSHFQGYS